MLNYKVECDGKETEVKAWRWWTAWRKWAFVFASSMKLPTLGVGESVTLPSVKVTRVAKEPEQKPVK